MSFTSDFLPLALEDLRRQAAFMKAEGWRFVQTHAVDREGSVDLYYSFMKEGHLRNYRIEGVGRDQIVPSITDLFLAAFVFENEARELFGVNMGPIAIDFDGMMYAPAVGDPMTIISPEQKAAREKARKAAAAKAAKEAQAAAPIATGDDACRAVPASGRKPFVMTPQLQARLDAKMPSLSPEKAAKVKAALEARAAEASDAATPMSNEEARSDARAAGQALACETPQQKKEDAAFSARVADNLTADSQVPVDQALIDALQAMDPQKAQRVKSALEGRPAPSIADLNNPAGVDQPPIELLDDGEMEALLQAMDPDRAQRVIAALAQKEED